MVPQRVLHQVPLSVFGPTFDSTAAWSEELKVGMANLALS
jgi:hypothetical protein